MQNYSSADTLEDIYPSDAASIRNAQDAYRECVEATIDILKRRGITYVTKEDVSWLGFANGLEDVLESAVKQEIKNFDEIGFDVNIRGDDHVYFFDRMYAKLKEKPPQKTIKQILAENVSAGDLVKKAADRCEQKDIVGRNHQFDEVVKSVKGLHGLLRSPTNPETLKQMGKL